VDADFLTLGQLTAYRHGQPIDLGRRRERCLLGVLLLQAGQVATVERLLDLLWDGNPPATGRASLHTHIARLRGHLRAGGAGPSVLRLAHSGNGYLAEIDRTRIDAYRFQTAVEQARDCAEPVTRVALLRQALALWRGPVLARDAPQRLRDRIGAHLVELRMSAIELTIDTELELGRHRELLGELTTLTAEHPYNERFLGQLMLATYRTGRESETLEIYERFRARLAADLGVDPGPELRRIHLDVLRHDPAIAAQPAPAAAVRAATPGRPDPPPALLPADVGDFIGRREQLAAIRSTLTDPRRTVRTAVITGQGGSGKTTLAVRVAHQMLKGFPDGQLYANLRGTQPTVSSPFDVLGRFLRCLGIEGRAMPEGLDERMDLYRSLLAQRRMLVLLDDARDPAQVRPLLPGSSRCATIVTSRSRLLELDGASPVTLNGFSPDEAARLLRALCGSGRVDSHPADTAKIARLCGHLPLAIRIAGVRLAARPHWPLSMLASRLSDAHRRLDELASGDLAVAATFAISYRLLDADARRTLRMLSLLETDDFAAWTAAALLDTDVRRAEDLIETLVDAHLLEAASLDPPGHLRYRFHDLVRLFARARGEVEDSEADRLAAIVRALGAWLDLTERAAAALPYRLLAPIRGGAVRYRLEWTDPTAPPADPFAWLAAEHAALIATIHHATALGLDELAWEIAAAARDLFEQRDHVSDFTATHAVALRACQLAGNRRGEAVMMYGRACMSTRSPEMSLDLALELVEGARSRFHDLGETHGEVDALVLAGALHRMHGDHATSGEVLTRAVERARTAGNETAEAAAWRSLGALSWERRDITEARRCFSRALGLSRRANLPDVEAFALRGLGLIHRELGDLEAARDFFVLASSCYERLGHQTGLAYAILDLGQLYTRCGDARARVMLERASALHTQVGDFHGQAVALRALGELSQAEGDLEQAVRQLTRSLALWRELRQPYGTALALRTLGSLHRAAGFPEQARAHWREARTIFNEIGSVADTANLDRDLAALAMDRRDPAGP
jgi:DNA-binding SARP family transcriptional activator/tetratricopeptide (TPR) repeat protein